MRVMVGVCFVTIVCSSCLRSAKKDDRKGGLISCESEFVIEDGEHATSYYENRENFIQPYTNASYSGDTLRAETLHEVNSCAETIGEIRYSNDTLYLSTKRISNEVCASVEFHRFNYTVVKENIESYTIVF